MSKIITISIPETLHAEIQEFKSKINVSKISREAIMEQIATLKAAQFGDLIEFLKAGKGSYVSRYKKIGREFARGAIADMKIDYSAFIRIEELNSYANKDTTFDISFDNTKEWLGTSFPELWDLLCKAIYDGEDKMPGFDADAFLTGFIGEISLVWSEVKSKI